MRYLILSLSIFSFSFAKAQVADDALRYGFPLTGGTARSQAISGAVGALGGDISNAHVNPAGIGFYKNGEFVLSPAYNLNNNNYTYFGGQLKSNKSKFAYGTSGLVFGKEVSGRKMKSNAFAFTINQIADYNNIRQYSGLNTNSSWSEQYVEELVAARATPAQAESNFIFGSSLAYYTYLVDTISGPNGTVLGYQSIAPVRNGNAGVIQNNLIATSGSANELSIAGGANLSDKFYFGGAVGIPFYRYSKDQTYRESDASNNPNNDFSYFEYRELYETSGVGFNLKAGLIFKPVERLRLGLAVHSPTFATLTDKISSSIETNSEGFTVFPQPQRVTSDELKGNNNAAGFYEYSLSTPLKVLGSFAYVLNEVKDVVQQKGFISADIEMVNYKGIKYAAADGSNGDDAAYYNSLNNTIKSRYKNALNARLGGELKFKTLMVRAGGAYMGSPYADNSLKGTRTQLSGGLGYRNRGVFVDLAYVHTFIRSSDVAYYLQDLASPVADGKNNRGQVALTVGFKFL